MIVVATTTIQQTPEIFQFARNSWYCRAHLWIYTKG